MSLYKVTYKLPVKVGRGAGQKNGPGLISVSNYYNEKGLQDFVRRTPICVGPIMISICKQKG